MTLRQLLIRSIRMTPEPVTHDYGITDALAARKAARPDRQRAAGKRKAGSGWVINNAVTQPVSGAEGE